MAARRAQYVRYYLREGPSGSVTSLNDGALARAPAAGETPTGYAYPDWEWTSGAEENGRTGGRIRCGGSYLHLGAARGRSRGHRADLAELRLVRPVETRFIVKLAEQEPQEEAARATGAQPSFTNVSKGWLKASHREKDKARATTLRPFYTHTNPQPLTPGEIYQLDIEVLPTGLFREGHRIRLEITNAARADRRGFHPSLSAHGDRNGHHPASRGAHPSCLLLPVVKTESDRARKLVTPPPHLGGLSRRYRTMRIGMAVLLAPFRTWTAHVMQLRPIAVAPALGPSATDLYGCRHAGGEQNDVGSRSGQQCNGTFHDDCPISLVVQQFLGRLRLRLRLHSARCSTAMARLLDPRLLISSATSRATRILELGWQRLRQGRLIILVQLTADRGERRLH